MIDQVPLKMVAYARSGDKGSHANIGVIAYTEAGYQFLRGYLTDDIVKDYFLSLGVEDVVRYELPNLLAFNFVLKNALDGGGSLNLCNDAQGKTLGQRLLELHIPIQESLLVQSQRG